MIIRRGLRELGLSRHGADPVAAIELNHPAPHQVRAHFAINAWLPLFQSKGTASCYAPADQYVCLVSCGAKRTRREVINVLAFGAVYAEVNRLDLENYFLIAYKIRLECLNQCAAAVLQCLRWFRQKWNSLKFELDLQTLMINRLEKPAALISINGKARPDDRVAVIFVNQFCFFFLSCHWCVSWAKTLSC